MGGRGASSWLSRHREDIPIHRSIGAAYYFGSIKDIDGSIVECETGTSITDVQVIAGAGHRRKIDEVERLKRKYGGKTSEWKKLKGKGTIIKQGIQCPVELHWYELGDDPIPYELKVKDYLW